MDLNTFVQWTLGGAVIIGAIALSLQSKGKRLRWIILSGAVAAILVAAMPAVNLQQHMAAEPIGSQLQFQEPPQPVKECQTYDGDGTIPDGYELVFFDRPVTEAHAPSGYFHMTETPASNNPSGAGWRSPVVHAGAEHVEIVAVLMTNDLYITLKAITLDTEDSNQGEPTSWKLNNVLPPGHQLEPLFVSPNLGEGCR
jgi:hypothetical protein